MKDLALYIHVPFCKSKCYYCDFISYSNRDDIISKYIEYLKKEIDMYVSIIQNYSVKTIFIGGGTPSYIEGKYIYDILEYLFTKIKMEEIEEITIEANPNTIDDERLKIYKESGINRISLGAQCFSDDILKSIGRIHNSKDIYDSIYRVRDHGFNNLNLDLIFGLPNQSMKDVLESINETVKLDIEHISYYSLILEEDTPFFNSYKKGKLNVPDEDLEREMYHKGKLFLDGEGYKHYEISNFAKEGYECKHNLFYWQLKPYIGLGLAAHSNICGYRYWNYNNFEDYFSYIDNGFLPVEDKEKIDNEMEMAEYVILGLRLIKGVQFKDFYDRFKISLKDIYGEVLEKHKKNGLLDMNEYGIKLTNRGLDLSNLVFIDILP